MRTLLTALTCLMLFATPVVAGEYDDADAAYKAGDFPKAFRLFKPFAEQGLPSVQYNLGYMYAHGEGISEDYLQASAWYSVSAEQGVEKARENKGIRWIESQVCKQDRRRPILLTNDNDRRFTPRYRGDPNESLEALSDLLNASLRLAFWNVEKYPSKQSLAWRIEYCGK